MEPEAGIVSLLLRTIVDCHIVKVDRTSTISPIMWLKEVSNENLAAEGVRVSRSSAECISASCNIDIATQLKNFTTHINAIVQFTSRALCTKMVATNRLDKLDHAALSLITLNNDSLTVVRINICGWEPKFVAVLNIEIRFHE